MDSFALHPQLATDTALIGRIAGCQLLLMNDARYPWLILVPEHDDMQELHELAEASYVEVTQGIRQISEKLQALMNAPKMNIAALGNQVPQLHIHIIARRHDDHAWPGPVWGVGDAVPYDKEEQRLLMATLQKQLLS
jgi:diadenosine tetraphosphate (Ap4A) HIT family hydrolase